MPSPKEDAILAAYFSWVRLMALSDARYKRIIHIPNEGWRPGALGARAKVKGLTRGVPDVLGFCRQGNRPGFALEFKRDDGKAKVSPEQADWLTHLTAERWVCAVVRSFTAAQILTEAYFAGLYEKAEGRTQPDKGR